jgi:hypothetical protein
MIRMSIRKHAPVILITVLLIIQLTPVSVRAWSLDSGSILTAIFPGGDGFIYPTERADLNADGRFETLAANKDRLSILSADAAIWESPAGWQVVQAAFTDLNHDGVTEVSLLVWRAFQPWPVDEFLPFGGRIADFHDQEGRSCHLILVGWRRGGIDEVWAGSALAEPVTAFRTADLDDDTDEELITLEGEYAGKGSSPARTLKVWKWNGFGFSSVSSMEGSYTALLLFREENGRLLILTP